MLKPLEVSGRSLNVTLTLHDCTNAEMLASVFRAIAAARPEGLVVLPDAFLTTHRARIVEQIARMSYRPFTQIGSTSRPVDS